MTEINEKSNFVDRYAENRMHVLIQCDGALMRDALFAYCFPRIQNIAPASS